MRTVGAALREGRRNQDISYEELSRITKIRVNFLSAIENEEWSTLPEYPVVVGFVKNIADALSLDRDQMVALLRRDYPPKRMTVNPKPDVGTPFTWGPKLVFAAGAAGVVILVVGYLVLQYRHFVSPPVLVVTNPENGQIVTSQSIEVRGRTDPESTVIVNNQPALVEETGEFSAEIAVDENTVTIEITARSRGGKESIETRTISVDFEEN